MSDYNEITATITTEEPAVAATLDELRYLVFQGKKGDTGDSAYDEAVKLGFEGTEAEWLASLKGDPGKDAEGAVRYDAAQSLSDDQKEQARLNIDAVSERTYDTLEMDVENVKTAAYAHIRDASAHVSAADRERWNDGGGSAANAVLYTEQTLTTAQQEQARTNIGAGTYRKPSGGIPDSDIASAATWNAKGTYSKPSGGIPASDLAAGVIPDVSGKANAADVIALASRLNAIADSDDTTLDQLSEIVAYIKNNKSLIDNITTGKVSVSDIVDNLTSAETWKPLSANQGKALKALIDAIVVPTESTVSGWGFTKNTGTYSKPSGGIPKNDLAPDVQASLGKADTALQQHQSLAGYATETYVQQQIAAIPAELPAVTASDNGKFLRVVSGAWAAETVQTWQGGSY